MSPPRLSLCSGLTTLMSAFPSSRRVNLWLHWRQLFRALPGKAGGAVVLMTVDQNLMRGSKPHDFDASRSRLCLATWSARPADSRREDSPGSDRAPALPGGQRVGWSVGASLRAITGFGVQPLAGCMRPGESPNKPRQLTGNRGSDNTGWLLSELAVARAQPQLLSRRSRGSVWVAPPAEAATHGGPGPGAVRPGRLDQRPAGRVVPSLDKAFAFDTSTARSAIAADCGKNSSDPWPGSEARD